MLGELVDPDCDDLIANQILLYEGDDEYKSLMAEKARLDGEKARLDGEKARLDKSLAISRNEILIGSHVGSCIYMVDLMNILFFGAPENKFRNAYAKDGNTTPDAALYIERMLQKYDRKQAMTRADIDEFHTLFRIHSAKADQLISDTKEWKNKDIVDYLARIKMAYHTMQPRYDAAVRR